MGLQPNCIILISTLTYLVEATSKTPMVKCERVLQQRKLPATYLVGNNRQKFWGKMESFKSDEVSRFKNLGQFVNSSVTLWSLVGVTLIMIFFQILLPRRKKINKNVVIFKDLRDIPGLPIIGPALMIFSLEKVIYKALDVSQELGTCFRGSFFTENCVILNSPELVQSFLKSGDLGHVIKSPLVYDLMKPFIVNGVFVSRGKVWKSERKILSRFMFISNIKEYFPMLQKHVRRFVTTLETLYKHKNQQPYTINDPVNISFLEIITELLTGADLHGTQTGLDYHHDFETWKSTSFHRIFKPWLLLDISWKFHPLRKNQLKAIQPMARFSQQRLFECKKQRLQKSDNETKFQTMIDAMLDADVSDEQIIDEINTMMFGGHDTTAGTIQYFFLLMALNPHYQKLCRNELDHVFDATNGQLRIESLSQFNYLERCILESLRMFPVVGGFGRKLKSPLNIDYNNKTLSLEPGMNIGVSPWLLHRNPEYFPNPNVFDPNRFLPEECAKRHSHAFLPFSAGPRNCLGVKFAMMQLKLVAAHVLHKFEVTTIEKMEDIVLLPIITIVPKNDFRFIFKSRC